MASRMRSFLSALAKLGTVGLILIAFAFGLAATVYVSLRSPEVQVPDLSGKTYNEGQTALASAGLSLRERARRYKPGANPGVILDQSPRGGEVVKKGQTIAVVVSRAPKEGEAPAEEVAEDGQGETNSSSGGKGTPEANENQNRERRSRGNRNTNSNANKNSNNSNGGNRNAAVNQNGNRNSNANRANPNANNRNTNANRNRNANNRNTNSGGGRNTNQPRTNTNRRPPER